MKKKFSTLCTISISLATFCSGCNEEKLKQQLEPAKQGQTTTAVSTTAVVTDDSTKATVVEQPVPGNAQLDNSGALPNIDTMRLTLTTELSRNASVIFLGRGLYFFKAGEDEYLEVVNSFQKEHTNLVNIATYSAYENYSKAWYTGNSFLNLSEFPRNLFISNGVFAVFRNK